jgi:hypothetical protein
MDMDRSLAARKVRTLDGALCVFEDRDWNSAVIFQPPHGSEIQLGAVTEVHGREWIEAALPDGLSGYVLGASIRSHTTSAADVTQNNATQGQPGLAAAYSGAYQATPKAVVFTGSTGEAAKVLLAYLGWAVLIVTAAWGYVRLYSWLIQSLHLDDGTKARFTGDPKKIWFSAMTLGLFPSADRWLSHVINAINDEATRTILILVLLVAVWSAQTVVLLRVWRWTGVGPSGETNS